MGIKSRKFTVRFLINLKRTKNTKKINFFHKFFFLCRFAVLKWWCCCCWLFCYYFAEFLNILFDFFYRWSLIPLNKDENGVPQKYPNVPFQRYGHTAVAFENKVFIWGGRNDEMVSRWNFVTADWSLEENYLGF